MKAKMADLPGIDHKTLSAKGPEVCRVGKPLAAGCRTENLAILERVPDLFSGTAAMDTLPDELLLHVVAFVADSATLLDAVPLVCKKWKSISRDRRAWVNTDLHWEGRHTRSVVPPLEARVLLRAPALRDVVLDPGAADHWLASALDRSHIVITGQVTLKENVWTLPDPSWGGTVVLDLLWRSRQHLLGLSIWLNDDARDEVDSEGRPPLGVVAGLARLQHLQLDWVDEHPYAGELRDALPALRRLVVIAMHPGDPFRFVDEAPRALLADLVRAAAATLRLFQYDSFEGLPEAVVQCLARCTELRELVANGSCMAAARGWPRVRQLRLMFAVRDSDSAARFATALSQCVPLACLRRLHLSVFHDARGRLGSAADKAQCAHRVAAFKEARPDVQVSFSQT